jgi:hypothetical protein
MFGGLMQFAAEHEGWFPKSDLGSYAALTQLYPNYCNASELAGVSGNIGVVDSLLKQGTTLDDSSTSWVYMQGFKKGDNPNLAVLWESRSGLYPNGKRNSFGGRAVLLLNGDITNVPAAQWEKFQKYQEQLRGNARDTQR